MEVFELAIPVANEKFNDTKHMTQEGIWKYMAGVVWNMINSREIDYNVTEETAAVYTESDVDEVRVDAYWEGRRVGRDEVSQDLFGKGVLPHQDFLQAHVFKMTSPFINQFKEGGSPPWRETEHLFA